MNKIYVVIGFAVGYVLGAKAGRGRYEDIRAQADRVWQHPKVQEAAHHASDAAKQAAGSAGTAAYEKAKEAATTAVSAAKVKVDELTSKAPAEEAEPQATI